MSQALYRRYRPETFADVIGQEHVTEPLMQALRSDRVSHAYLFSGPRGCGKTTSARILARCLNCEQGPTPTPCGSCDSCVGLARNGPGTMDVIEIDAASHGRVDDARDLREKAFFSPGASRYKIYIVDEAHMVTKDGFNALLKIVEEPPAHLKFIFATTEPDKVLSTIRSRTHHYPFRLVAPGRLQDYLAQLCEEEKATVAKGVLPLVVRAGRGSVRDSLSVLDQLIAGTGPDGVTYALATSLLGFTDETLLDDTITGLSAGDAAAVFGVINRVIEAGHDPRRFAEDLLERLRDLIILAAVPDAADALLGGLAPDQLERMRGQASLFGAAELSRAADLINEGLTEMKGTTAPRLQLELMCARVLLPGAEGDVRSLQARLDRIERRLTAGGGMPAPSEPAGSVPAQPAAPAEPVTRPAAEPVVEPAPPSPPATAPQAQAAPAPPQAPEGVDITAVRRLWPDVLTVLAGLRRASWTLVSQNAQVVDLAGRTLTLGFPSAGLRDTFSGGAHPEYVHQALIDVLGVDWRVEAIVDPSAGGGPALPSPPLPTEEQQAADEPVQPAAPRQRLARPPAHEAAAFGTSAPVPDEPSPEDDDLDADNTRGAALVEQMLGAKVIGEFDTT